MVRSPIRVMTKAAVTKGTYKSMCEPFHWECTELISEEKGMKLFLTFGLEGCWLSLPTTGISGDVFSPLKPTQVYRHCITDSYGVWMWSFVDKVLDFLLL